MSIHATLSCHSERSEEIGVYAERASRVRRSDLDAVRQKKDPSLRGDPSPSAALRASAVLVRPSVHPQTPLQDDSNQSTCSAPHLLQLLLRPHTRTITVEEGTPSITAIGSAMVRAAHLLWDDAPKIFEDTFALRLCGCDSEAALRAQFDRLHAQLERSAGPSL
jgi:hypothetical protein